MKTLFLISAVIGSTCQTQDHHGIIIGPVIEMRILRSNQTRQFCVERQGCFSRLIGSCEVVRNPAGDDDTTEAWSVK